jgi:hypothetical protein
LKLTKKRPQAPARVPGHLPRVDAEREDARHGGGEIGQEESPPAEINAFGAAARLLRPFVSFLEAFAGCSGGREGTEGIEREGGRTKAKASAHENQKAEQQRTLRRVEKVEMTGMPRAVMAPRGLPEVPVKNQTELPLPAAAADGNIRRRAGVSDGRAPLGAEVSVVVGFDSTSDVACREQTRKEPTRGSQSSSSASPTLSRGPSRLVGSGEPAAPSRRLI